MPIFEYKYSKFGAVTEFLESSGKEIKHNCSQCGSGDMKKMFSSFAVGISHEGTDSKCRSCTDSGCPHANG